MDKLSKDVSEGVTQYRLDWQQGPLPACAGLDELNQWRTRFFDLGVIGQCRERYGGVGFGNVSVRLAGPEFLVSGTQTGHLRVLSAAHYCRVLACDVHHNYVRAEGPLPPSSEAMTHHMIYQCVPSAQCVIHIHAPILWRAAAQLELAITPAVVGYGTPAMAAAVSALIARRVSGKLADGAATDTAGIVAMGGHEDGIIAWSDGVASVGDMLRGWLQRAAAIPVPDPIWPDHRSPGDAVL